MNWQPIETAPTGIDVFVWDKYGGATVALQVKMWNNAKRDYEYEWFTGYTCADKGEYTVDNPTHWCKIEAPIN